MLHDKDIREPLFDFLDEPSDEVLYESTSLDAKAHGKIRIMKILVIKLTRIFCV